MREDLLARQAPDGRRRTRNRSAIRVAPVKRLAKAASREIPIVIARLTERGQGFAFCLSELSWTKSRSGQQLDHQFGESIEVPREHDSTDAHGMIASLDG